jgi:respiratory burst oxidase
MVNSKEFAVCIFDALARRKRQRITKISKEELHDFWLQISDQSFDARLQIFFDMCVSLSLSLSFFSPPSVLYIIVAIGI